MESAPNASVPPSPDVQLPTCANLTTAEGLQKFSQSGALLYIVTVLLFYAFAMVVLMIKYIRRENQEAQLSYYFVEFVKREKFQSATYQNKCKVGLLKKELDNDVDTSLREYRVTAV